MRRLKHILYGVILLLGVVAAGCGSIVYDDQPCPPPSSHVYIVGPSRFYYPSGHPYFRPAPPPPRPRPQAPPPGRRHHGR